MLLVRDVWTRMDEKVLGFAFDFWWPRNSAGGMDLTHTHIVHSILTITQYFEAPDINMFTLSTVLKSEQVHSHTVLTLVSW